MGHDWIKAARRQLSGWRGPKSVPPQTSSVTEDGNLGPVYVFIRTWNRPLYLWACLDSLFRNTRTPCRFVLMDNQSSDRQVAHVIEGFRRRGMFEAVHMMDRNHGANQTMLFFKYRPQMGRYFVLLDGDITVEAGEPDWLGRMIRLAEARPNLAILGSVVDQEDFVDVESAQRLAPTLSEDELDRLIKGRSPERRLKPSRDEVIAPYTPPGRLLLLRTAAIDEIGLRIGNMALSQAAKDAGYQVGIATTVRHRHLSLLNIFDYPDYDFAELSRYLQGV